MIYYKIELHGISRFSIYYNCDFSSSGIIENIHVAVACNSGVTYSILHLHVFTRTL